MIVNVHQVEQLDEIRSFLLIERYEPDFHVVSGGAHCNAELLEFRDDFVSEFVVMPGRFSLPPEVNQRDQLLNSL